MVSCACKLCSAGLSDELSDAYRDLTPHPQYAAFYKWLQQDYKADAVVHFGMHGTVEWLPGAPLGQQHVTFHMKIIQITVIIVIIAIITIIIIMLSSS